MIWNAKQNFVYLKMFRLTDLVLNRAALQIEVSDRGHFNCGIFPLNLFEIIFLKCISLLGVSEKILLL